MRIVLLLIACALIIGAPKRAHAGNPAEASRTMLITRDDLESIRRVAIDHYTHHSKLDRAPDMARDLGRVAPFLAGEATNCPCLGMWRLKYEHGHWLMEREPPIDTLMFYFGVELQRDGTQWIVVREFVREERMQPGR